MLIIWKIDPAKLLINQRDAYRLAQVRCHLVLFENLTEKYNKLRFYKFIYKINDSALQRSRTRHLNV